MRTVIAGSRPYFWPIIIANMLAMTLCVNGDLRRGLLFAVVISLLASYGFIINNLWDINIDKVNRPKHLEDASGQQLAASKLLALGLLSIALILSRVVGVVDFEIALTLALLLMAYTVFLRKVIIVPTILAGVLSASPLWYPLLIWHQSAPNWSYLVVCSAILIICGRETIMDIRDRRGDADGDRQTLAIICGSRLAGNIAFALTAVGAALLVVVIMLLGRSGMESWGIMALISLMAFIVHLVFWPVVRIIRGSPDDRTLIDLYVISSRNGMVVFPCMLGLILLFH